MNKGFFDALASLGDENSVETEVLVEKVKSALLKAARKAKKSLKAQKTECYLVKPCDFAIKFE